MQGKALQDQVEDSLPRCPVCYERLSSPRPVYQCEEGHLVCAQCGDRPQLQHSCPVCRGQMLGRAIGVEQFLQDLNSSLIGGYGGAGQKEAGGWRMENIPVCIAFLGLAIATDYYHTSQVSPVGSAVPIFIFQLLMMANKMVQNANGGNGILKCIWLKLRGRQQ